MSQNHSTVIYLLVTYFSLNYHQKWSCTSWGAIQDRACLHMTEAGGNCPRSCSGHCTPLLKELSHEQSAGVSSSRAEWTVTPFHSAEAEGWLKGESAAGNQGQGLFVPCRVPPSIPRSSASPQELFGCLCLSLPPCPRLGAWCSQ